MFRSDGMLTGGTTLMRFHRPSPAGKKERGMTATGPHSAGRTAPLIGFETVTLSKQGAVFYSYCRKRAAVSS